jgi:hypothetical protein
MPASRRTVRLFVSSTFSDMKAERDLLQREVFPRVRQLCSAKGLRFQAIDLRWGVSEEAGLHNRTMRICLGELQRCLENRIKPNFLILLGDRYGWRPLPEAISAGLFERLEKSIRTNDAKLAQLLTHHYRRDANAVPAEYVLQPRRPPLDNPGCWSKQVEIPLRTALLEAAKALVLEGETAKLGLGLSATHQEIIQGALRVADAREHVHAFVRTIRYGPGQMAHRDFVDLGVDDSPDLEAEALRDQLRREIESKLGPSGAESSNLHSYTVDWQEQGQFTQATSRDFPESVFTTLTGVIQQQLANLESISADQLEEQAHEDFGGFNPHQNAQ